MVADEEYYRRYLKGDDSAIEALIIKYNNELVRFLEGMVGNYHDAEDLFQDIFARVALKKSVFRGRSQFKTWLYAIARHEAIDFMRKKKLLAQELLLDENEWNLIHADECLEPEKAYALGELQDEILQTIKSFNSKMYQVMYLKLFGGFEPEEIADIMGLTRDQVYVIIHEAREKLKREL